MMKKIIGFLLMPAFLFGIIRVISVAANDEVDYDIQLGNQLSDVDVTPNQYVEIPDKPTLSYNFIIPDTFDLMAEDEELELYLEPETLAIAIRVKANGYVYSSYNFNDSFAGKSAAVTNPIKSGVRLELYKESTPTSTSFLDVNPIATGDLVPAAEATIQPQSDGFVAKIDFSHPEIMIKFDLSVSIENGSLYISIPADSIVEYNPNLGNSNEQFYLLRNIVVFPYFGSTKGEDDGYVFIPDGSGAIITLDKTPQEKASFSLNVYGSDAGYQNPTFQRRGGSTKQNQRVTMPLYGMIHDVGNTGFYVVSEQGENYSILNYKSAGIINDYYNTYFSYRYRQSYQQYQSRSNEDQYRISFQDDPNEYDVSVRYTFLSGSDADYVGMAKSYQQDLLDRGVLTTSKRKTYDSAPIKVDVIGSEITEGILRLKTQEVTRYSEVIDIVKTLQDDGYTNLITSFKTFSLDEYGYRFEIFRQLGGKDDFQDMLQFMEEEGIEFSYYLDYARSYSNYRNRHHAQTLSKRQIFYIQLSQIFFAHNVNDTRYYQGFAEEDIDDFRKYDITNLAFNGFDRSVYTGWNDRVVYGVEHMDNVTKALDLYRDNGFTTGLYNPDRYLYPYMSVYYDAPITSSDFSITSATIPFVQLVLGGYVDMYSPYLNFASNEEVTRLRLVEFGVYPSYVLTGGSAYDLKRTNSSNVYISEYDVLKTRIDDTYQAINRGLQATTNKEMVDHTFVGENLILVQYDDGSQILLNYNSSVATYDTYAIPAYGYVVIS